jgi:hypothetical protein
LLNFLKRAVFWCAPVLVPLSVLFIGADFTSPKEPFSLGLHRVRVEKVPKDERALSNSYKLLRIHDDLQ